MAAALPEAEARDADAGWQGHCGLVDIVSGCESNLATVEAGLTLDLRPTIAQISPDELVLVLKLADQHTRAVWSELVCKSFRCARHRRSPHRVTWLYLWWLNNPCPAAPQGATRRARALCDAPARRPLTPRQHQLRRHCQVGPVEVPRAALGQRDRG